MFGKLRSVNRLALVASLIALGLTTVPATAAFAQQAGSQTIASGLVNPRGLTFGSDGTLYVAEAGAGGDQVITAASAPGAEGPTEVRLGLTGQVSKITLDGRKSVVARNLPSWVAQGEASGPSSVVYERGALWVTTGGTRALIGAVGFTPRPNDGSVLRIDPQSGATQSIANLQEYEGANNPDGFIVDSNPAGLALGRDGMLYVADAGGNALYKVDPSNGQFQVVTVFGGFPLPAELQGPGPFAQGNPTRNGRMEMDPVPTGVTVGPDGKVYVGLLSGFPFPQGAAKVVSVGSNGGVTDAVSGLTMVVDVEFGPDGMLYVSEFGQFSFGPGGPPGFTPNSGRVVRVMPDGTKQTVAGNLNAAYGIAFDGSGNLYVVVNSISLTDGQVLRFSNVAGGAAGQVGMPRTGEGFSLDQAVYLSLLLIVGGCTLLLTSHKFTVRRRDLQ